LPILNDLLTEVLFLAAMPAVVGVFLTATLLIVSQDWRLNVIALAAQYFFVALLMTQTIRVEMAAVKGLIGWVICLVFYLTEQQAQLLMRRGGPQEPLSLRDWFAGRLEGWRHEGVSARAGFGFMATVLVGVTVYAISSALPLPQVSRSLTVACYALGGLGILLIGLSRDPLRVGAGMLMFLSGFDLFYVALEPSLLVTGFLGLISFIIALGAAYLKAAQVTVADGEGAP
jgi:hypothetical protein